MQLPQRALFFVMTPSELVRACQLSPPTRWWQKTIQLIVFTTLIIMGQADVFQSLLVNSWS